MRYYDIALFIFIFNLMLGFLQVVLVDYTDYHVGDVEGFGKDDIQIGEEQLAEQINDVYTPIWSELNWLVENVRLVVQGVATFIQQATFSQPCFTNHSDELTLSPSGFVKTGMQCGQFLFSSRKSCKSSSL